MTGIFRLGFNSLLGKLIGLNQCRYLAIYTYPIKNTKGIDGQSSRRICLQGNHAIYNRIPCENVFLLDHDGHTMVSLDDKLDTLFAMGLYLDLF